MSLVASISTCLGVKARPFPSNSGSAPAEDLIGSKDSSVLI